MARGRKVGRPRKAGAKRALRARNPLALATRRLGRRVKPSSKLYRRRSKHRPGDEG